MHKLNFMHRDLKTANILLKLNNNKKIEEVKLTDFGFSKHGIKGSTYVVTKGYILFPLHFFCLCGNLANSPDDGFT